MHIGDVTTEYAPGLTVHHKGYVNGTAALDHLAAAFPGATDVVVMGESAGSIAAPLYAGLVSDRLPDARITVLADASGSYPDVRPFNEVFAAWGFGNAVPPWPENAGLTAEQWSAPGLFIQSGRHDPEIVFARHDYAYDERQEFWYPLLGTPAEDLLSLIDANEAQIEGAGVNLLSYIAPGDEHTVLSDGSFYTETVNGVLFVDWVTQLVNHQPVADVHCQECDVGDRPSDEEQRNEGWSEAPVGLAEVARRRAARAGATSAGTVRIMQRDGRLAIDVEDDGNGGPTRAPALESRGSSGAYEPSTGRSRSRT